MWVRLAAAALFVALVLWLARLALGLRWAKVTREQARQAREVGGGRVVAEIPSRSGDVQFFVDEGDAFTWPGGSVRKDEVAGARLLLRGGLVGSFERAGASLPPPGPVDEDENRERWDVVVYVRDGAPLTVACGTLREGVSRDAAARVFEALRAV